jgi:hypothetical protein
VLTIDGDGYLQLSLAAAGGLANISGELSIDLDTDPGLALSAGGIAVLASPNGGLQVDATGVNVVEADLRAPTRSVSATGSIALTDQLVLADASGGDVVLTLPTLTTGKLLTIKRTDAVWAHTVTVSGDGGDTIDGAASQTLVPDDGMTILGGPSEWSIV